MGKPAAKGAAAQSAPDSVVFFLDECLPYQVASVLAEMKYPIVSWQSEFNGKQGTKDKKLIPYLGEHKYVWITKDDEARKDHEPEIRAASISVVWVRGLERHKGAGAPQNHITVKQLHRMLTDKLDHLANQIIGSRSPGYFNLYLESGGTAVCRPTTLERQFHGQH